MVNDSMRKIFVHLHIPKCSGSSVTDVLFRKFTAAGSLLCCGGYASVGAVKADGTADREIIL